MPSWKVSTIFLWNLSNLRTKSALQSFLHCFISNPLWWCIEAKTKNCVIVQIFLDLIAVNVLYHSFYIVPLILTSAHHKRRRQWKNDTSLCRVRVGNLLVNRSTSIAFEFDLTNMKKGNKKNNFSLFWFYKSRKKVLFTWWCLLFSLSASWSLIQNTKWNLSTKDGW